MEKVAANYSVFLVELRALALAVLAVQVCCRERGYLGFLQRARIDGFVAEPCGCPALTATGLVTDAAQRQRQEASGLKRH